MFSHKHGADTTFDETDADYKNTGCPTIGGIKVKLLNFLISRPQELSFGQHKLQTYAF